MRIFKYILFILCLYIYIYNPIFKVLGFGSIKLLLLLSFIYLLFKGFYSRFFGIFKNEIIFTSILILYPFLSTLMGNISGITVSYMHFIWFLECFIIPTFLVLYFKDIFNWFSWESIVVQVGFLASIITFFLILNPTINIFIRNSVIIESLDDLSGNMYFRGFSLAENSAFGYGVIQGLILSICLFSIKKSIGYIIPIIFLLVSIMFNARIGLVPVLISLFLLIVNKKINLFYIITFSSIIFLAYWFLFYSSFAKQNETTLKWSLGIFKDAQNFMTGKSDNKSTNFTYLFGSMFFLPSDFCGLIFGTGSNVFYNGSRNSDIGYVNQIFQGGLLYLLIMLLFLWKMFKRNCINTSNKLLPIMMFLTICVVNYKGNAFFVPSGFFRLISFYYIFSIFTSKDIFGKRLSEE